jgi:hypothetical protein
MKIIREQEPEAILAVVIGSDLAAQVVAMRAARDRVKRFDSYRAKLTLAVFQRASDPKLSAWEYVNRAANRKSLTQEYLKACVAYDAETGIFTAKLPAQSRQEGDILGSPGGSHGYLSVAVGGKAYLAHRLAWFYVHGEWPEQIDHVDRDRRNNRLSNLRPCTNQENNWNKAGAIGATWNSRRQRWVAKICHNSKTRTLGYFATLDEARACYQAEALKLRGHFLQEAA